MGIIHIVLFEFKSTTTSEQVEEICRRMLALSEICVNATTNRPYIKSLTGGSNNSPEPHAKPYTHGFVVEFDNESDRAYYLNEDPKHLDFVKFVGGLVNSVKVFDYEPGHF